MYSGAVYDVLKKLYPRGTNFVLPNNLVPMWDYKSYVFAKAFTVRGRKMSERDLQMSNKVLDAINSQCIYILQANDNSRAHIGDIGAKIMQRNGAVGAIIQGWARDTLNIEKLQFPVWAKGRQPLDAGDIWGIYEYNCEIVIGNIFITPNDYLFADRDGILVIRGKYLPDLKEEIRVFLQKEDAKRSAVDNWETATKIKEDFGRW